MKMIDKIKGILNKKTLTPEQIAKKHKVSVEYVHRQLLSGMKIEREHTKHDIAAREIALDHLGEKPDYYEKLKKYVE